MSSELPLDGAFRHGEAAAAAGAIQRGFAFTHAADVAFALGFPWARAWGEDVAADDVDAIVRAPRWGVCWPPSIGRARDRFEAIVRRAPVERQPRTITGVLDRALHGRAGAERNGLAVGPEGPGMHPSSLWFVNDDAAFVRDQILLNDEAWPGFFVDSRCAFLGGPDVVRYYVQRWWDVDPSATTAMFDELGLLRDPAIVELMMMASGEPEHVETASAWMTLHRDHARPILEALARSPRKRMAEESTRWLERLAQ